MIDVVVAFALANMAFEFVLLSMVAPKWRLRLLGNPTACVVTHLSMLSLNLLVHWGTLIGTMSSIVSFVASIFTIWLARKVWGSVVESRFYTTGLVRYSAKELT